MTPNHIPLGKFHCNQLSLVCGLYLLLLPPTTGHFHYLFLCQSFCRLLTCNTMSCKQLFIVLVCIKLYTDFITDFEWPTEEHYGSPYGLPYKALRQMDLSLTMWVCLTAPYTGLLAITMLKNNCEIAHNRNQWSQVSCGQNVHPKRALWACHWLSFDLWSNSVLIQSHMISLGTNPHSALVDLLDI